MPFDLKRFCLTIPAEFSSLEKTDDSSDYELFSSDNQVFYTYLKKTPVTLTERQHPILSVKGVGEHYDELQVSSAPISQSDYPEAYSRLLDGRQGDAIFDTLQNQKQPYPSVYQGCGCFCFRIDIVLFGELCYFSVSYAYSSSGQT